MSERTSGRFTRGAAIVAALGLVVTMASTELAVAKTTTKKATKKPAATTKKPKAAPTTTTTAAAAASKGTIKIGALGTSINSTNGSKTTEETRKIAQAWEKQVNSAGGINGYKVEIVYKDAQGDTARTLAAVKDLDKAGVVAVAGQAAAFQLTTIMDTVESRKLPLIGGSPTFDQADTSPMFFSATGNSFSNVFGLGASLRDAGASNLRVIYCSEIARCADSAPKIVAAFKSLGGSGSTSAASLAATDYTAQCIAAKKDGVDAVSLSAIPPSTFIRDCQRQNYHPIYQAGGLPGNKSTFDLVQGESYFSSLSEIPVFYTGPELAGYRTVFAKTDLTTNDATQGGLETYMALEMVRVVLNKMTKVNPTRADFLDALYTVKGETLGGLLPPQGVDYTGMKNGGKHSSIDCWVQWGLFEGGEWKITNKSGQPSKTMVWQCGSIFYK